MSLRIKLNSVFYRDGVVSGKKVVSSHNAASVERLEFCAEQQVVLVKLKDFPDTMVPLSNVKNMEVAEGSSEKYSNDKEQETWTTPAVTELPSSSDYSSKNVEAVKATVKPRKPL